MLKYTETPASSLLSPDPWRMSSKTIHCYYVVGVGVVGGGGGGGVIRYIQKFTKYIVVCWDFCTIFAGRNASNIHVLLAFLTRTQSTFLCQFLIVERDT